MAFQNSDKTMGHSNHRYRISKGANLGLAILLKSFSSKRQDPNGKYVYTSIYLDSCDLDSWFFNETKLFKYMWLYCMYESLNVLKVLSWWTRNLICLNARIKRRWSAWDLAATRAWLAVQNAFPTLSCILLKLKHGWKHSSKLYFVDPGPRAWKNTWMSTLFLIWPGLTQSLISRNVFFFEI